MKKLKVITTISSVVVFIICFAFSAFAVDYESLSETAEIPERNIAFASIDIIALATLVVSLCVSTANIILSIKTLKINHRHEKSLQCEAKIIDLIEKVSEIFEKYSIAINLNDKNKQVTLNKYSKEINDNLILINKTIVDLTSIETLKVVIYFRKNFDYEKIKALTIIKGDKYTYYYFLAYLSVLHCVVKHELTGHLIPVRCFIESMFISPNFDVECLEIMAIVKEIVDESKISKKFYTNMESCAYEKN